LAYEEAPAVLEYARTWPDTVKEGLAIPEILLKYILLGQPSDVRFHPEFFKQHVEFCRMLGNKMGYLLQQAIVPKSFRASSPIRLQLEWLNDGVAYLYELCHVAVALLDGKNKLVQKQGLAGSDPKKWPPGQSTTEAFDVPLRPFRRMPTSWPLDFSPIQAIRWSLSARSSETHFEWLVCGVQ
jgi:hypothetical protein